MTNTPNDTPDTDLTDLDLSGQDSAPPAAERLSDEVKDQLGIRDDAHQAGDAASDENGAAHDTATLEDAPIAERLQQTQ